MGGALACVVGLSPGRDSRSRRGSYRADVQKSLGLGCETCSEVEVVVDGTSTTLCQIRFRAEGIFCGGVLHVLYTS